VVHVGYQFRPGHPELGRAALGLRRTLREYGMFTGAAAEFADAFAPGPEEFVVAGRLGVSAFAGSDLDGYLRNNGITRLYLAGFALQTCVESTLRDAHDRGYEAHVVEDATAAFAPEQRAYVLDRVVPLFGGRVTAAALVDVLGGAPASGATPRAGAAELAAG
jgi:nicotinamidase-related amidase